MLLEAECKLRGVEIMVEHKSVNKEQASASELISELAMNDLNCGKLTKLIMSRHSIISNDLRYVAFNWEDINIFFKLREQ